MTDTDKAIDTASVVAKIVKELHGAERLELRENDHPDFDDGAEVLLLPAGVRPHAIKPILDEFRTRPERRKGTAMILDLESFVAHTRRFKDDGSALFADPGGGALGGVNPELTAVLDYHHPVVVAPEGSAPYGEPRWGQHRAVYTFPLTPEWVAWTQQDDKCLTQAEFAHWIEDHILDVADPEAAFSSAKQFAASLGGASFASPSRMLELSRGLTVHEASRVTQKINPSTGEATMHYEAAHEDELGAALAVPRSFLLQIPVFRGGPAYQLPVRLRYRIAGGKISWSFAIHNPERALDDAFREDCERAREATGLPLFFGSPER